jgi:hypothetical protein
MTTPTRILPAAGKTVRLENGTILPPEGRIVDLSRPYYQRRLQEGGIVVAPAEPAAKAPKLKPEKTDA